MRIISLLPSTTEIICAMGLESQLVGRSHECDYPDSVRSLPACTAPKYRDDGTSYEIDQRIKAVVQEGLSVYRVDADLLASLKPDLILTQDHCEVCAASYSDVQQAVNDHLDDDVEVVSVAPVNLDGVFLSILRIGEAAGAEHEAIELMTGMINSLNMLQSRTRQLPSPEVISVEWIDPLMSSGNWIPELVHIAGGKSLLATAGEHSPWIEWEEITEHDPDILLVSPCGYGIEKTTSEMEIITQKPGWKELKAVRNGRVFVMEGSHYFHRPGPRLEDSTEILAEIFHPGIFDPKHRENGWITFNSS